MPMSFAPIWRSKLRERFTRQADFWLYSGFCRIIGLGIYADFQAMLRLLQGFRRALLPVILSLTIFNLNFAV